MINVFTAELRKLRRRRIAVAAAGAAVLFAAVATIATFLSAEATAPPGSRATTLASLGRAEGVTEAFAVGASFTGILVLVVFIANVAGEFSQGTLRTLLLREPRRLAVLAGKLGALLTFAAAVLALMQVLCVGLSAAIAPTQDVSTASWFTLDGLGEAAGAYATAVLTVTAWASFGTAIAMLVRSAPLALGIGIAWSGPFEHLVGDVWTSADEWFPGLLLEAFAVGGSDEVAFSRALVPLAVYVAAALGAAAVTFVGRDVTA